MTSAGRERGAKAPLFFGNVSAGLRYAVVAAIAFAVDVSLLFLLSQTLGLGLLLANSLAFGAANVVNFLLGHVWVFGETLAGPRLGRRYGSVLLVSLAGLAINDALVWTGVNVLNAALIEAKILATLVAWSWNYQARRMWIYRKTTT
jgi:putative flippase GtrA